MIFIIKPMHKEDTLYYVASCQDNISPMEAYMYDNYNELTTCLTLEEAKAKAKFGYRATGEIEVI